MHSKLFFAILGLVSAVFFFAFIPSTADAGHCVYKEWWSDLSCSTGAPDASGPSCHIADEMCQNDGTDSWRTCACPPVINVVRVVSDLSAPWQTSDTTPDFGLTTDENATCKISTSDVGYDMMFTTCALTGGTTHTCQSPVSFSEGFFHNMYAACVDGAGNENDFSNNLWIEFFVLTPPGPLNALITLDSQLGLVVDVSGTTTFGGTPPYTYSWNYGDGFTATGGNPPSHTYATAGSKTITLTVTDSVFATDTTTLTVTLVGAVAPTANFSGTPLSVPVGNPVTFTDSSAPSSGETLNSWLWNFGDGTTSTSQNPSHSYTTTGFKTVSLTVDDTGPGGTDVETKLNYLQVTGVASLTALITLESQVGLVLDLSGTTTFGGTPPYTYGWDYGDGFTTTGSNPPSHTYATAGSKTITLTVTDFNSVVDTATLNVTLVTTLAPTANFSGTPLSVPVGNPVTFTDSSAPSSGETLNSWLWNFGDATTSTSQNPPPHSYTTTGPKTISLTVDDTGPGGTDVETKLNYVSVTVPGTFEITPVPPTALVCPTTPVGTPVTCNFQAVNGTGATVIINNVTSSNPTEFTPNVIPLPLSVLAGSTVNLPITFNATTAGTHNFDIIFTTTGTIGRLIQGTATTGAGEICTNTTDDDGDSAIDCADPDCSADPACAGAENCTDSIDNDGDGDVDCDDSGCSTAPSCFVPPVIIEFKNPLGSLTFADLINNVINFLFTIAVILAPILFVVAGVIFMTAAGDPGKVKTARSMLLWTIVGFGVILISKGLVTVLKSILGL